MNNENAPHLRPYPGKVLVDYMMRYNVLTGELAKRTGNSVKYIIDVITHEEPITKDFAEKMEHVFGTPAAFWVNLQKQYDDEEKDKGLRGTAL